MKVPLIFEIHGLQKSYRGRVVLDIPRMSFEPGRLCAVVGPNGAGKTTLLKILSFLEEPTRGAICFQGQPVNFSANGLPSLRRQVTLVMQNPLLFHTTVLKNVTYGLWVRGVGRAERKRRALEALDVVGLADFAGAPAQHLSGGEAQRVAIARALATNPKALLLDEPTANLDRANASAIEETLGEINRRYGTTVLFATHKLRQAYRVSGDVVSLLNGRPVESCPDNLFQGTIVERSGRKWFSMNGVAGFYVVADRLGQAHASVDPKEILVSLEPLKSSALNSLRGKIVGITKEGSVVRLTVDVGAPFVSLITSTSFEEMSLNINSTVYLTFKATSVEMY
ncbi:MAG: ABC transporter ATP-binding protein [bacterium]